MMSSPLHLDNAILLPIHPQRLSAILDGNKRYEFRSKPVGRVPMASHLILYATAPIKKLAAISEVKTIIRAEPKHLWDTCQPAGISRDEFDLYFHRCQRGTAIELGATLPISLPLSMIGINTAPRSFQYLSRHAQNTLEDLVNAKIGVYFAGGV